MFRCFFLHKRDNVSLFCLPFLADVLNRDGSDYSASIFGKLLQASAVQIWTDVDGVLSADPRKVPEAKVIREVRYYRKR